jgi:SpoVK/Ycf46/Vps4 family AAA+-type ATPase
MMLFYAECQDEFSVPFSFNVVDLPTEEARLKVLKVQLKGETLSDSVNLKDLAKRTVNYSGSDLRNVCVAAALARVKEDLVTMNNAKLSEEEIRDKISMIDDWNSYLKERPSNDTLSDFTLGPLLPKHFEIGIKECPPSLGDETQSLIDLRKWDKLYGDGAARKDKNVGIGFEVQNTNAKSL